MFKRSDLPDTAIAVHPFAAVFPMLPPDELQQLAEDIAANGLRQPIVLDAAGTLIDGRNRLAACKAADVQPTYDCLPAGVDPVAYVLSVNVNRRHLNKGQRAMAVAQARILNIRTFADVADDAGVSKAGVSHAATVIAYAKDLVDLVMAGAMPLNDAYKTAQERKQGVVNKETQMADLQTNAPDLANLVAEERLSLAVAVAELKERRTKHAGAVSRTRDRIIELLNGVAQLHTFATLPYRDEVIEGLNPNDRAALNDIEAIYRKGTKP